MTMTLALAPNDDLQAISAHALEIARESAEGAQDPIVNFILELAVTKTWVAILAHPRSYVMTRDEFAIFNYFQHRFIGIAKAVTARKRYWDQYTRPDQRYELLLGVRFDTTRPLLISTIGPDTSCSRGERSLFILFSIFVGSGC